MLYLLLLYCCITANALDMGRALLTSNIPDTERDALQDFYEGSGGNNWTCCQGIGTVPWNFANSSVNPCTERWQGITCSDPPSSSVDYHVTGISLTNQNLVGTLSNELSNLWLLTSLDISHNVIKGSIPITFGNLTSMESLSLDKNDFTGAIPLSFGQLSNMSSFDVSHNALTGNISVLSELTASTFLDISHNRLNGMLPETLVNLPSLVDLSLSNNYFVGPLPQFSEINTTLESLDFSRNGFEASPSAIGVLVKLSYLDLGNNVLTGEIPLSFANLTLIKSLKLNGNLFAGAIPDQLFENMAGLEFVAFSENSLTGTLPSSFQSLPALRNVLFGHNFLSGSLPSFFGVYEYLVVLQVQENLLTGPIPEDLCNLSNRFSSIHLNNNLMNGTIPSCMGGMTHLEAIEICCNNFTGTVPSSISALDKLRIWNVASNSLTGTLPSAFIVNGSFLSGLYFSFNMLTGTIPSVLGSLSVLNFLYLDSNSLSGTIPMELGNAIRLLTITVDNNYITGSLPANIASLQNLQNLDMNGNFLTGTVDNGIANMKSILFLELYNNCLSGMLPSIFGDYLEGIYLYGNQLSGTIGSAFHNLENLLYIDLHSNSMHGSVSFINCSELDTIVLSSNFFSGPLTDAFSHPEPIFLSSLAIDYNQFTGTLPPYFFGLPLVSLVASNNCFHGTLPDAICLSASTIQSLVLNGLSSASSCRSEIFPGLSSVYLLSEYVHGTLPPCIFKFPFLSVLQLSGNGFTGTLPEGLNISESLLDLTISHNFLTGRIDETFQTNGFPMLDLSFNKLGGTLLSDFLVFPHSTVKLSSNRLSGVIPSTFADVQDISILGSNLFSCDIGKSDLPSHDSKRSVYLCASQLFDIQYVIWLSIVCSVVLVSLVAIRYKSLDRYVGVDVILPRIRRLLSHSGTTSNTRLPVLATADMMTIYCVSYIAVILFPAYIVLSFYYGTYVHQYAYKYSAAFASGEVTFIVLFVVWMGLMVTFVLQLLPHVKKEAVAQVEKMGSDVKKKLSDYVDSDGVVLLSSVHRICSVNDFKTIEVLPLDSLQTCIIYTSFLTVNLVVVGGVNVAYVYIAIYESSQYLIWAQIGLAIFKLCWNLKLSHFLLAKLVETLTSPHSLDSKSFELANLQIAVGLLNNIVIPFCVVGFISPNCFYNVFLPPPEITSSSVNFNCINYVNITGDCVLAPSVTTVSYKPPFAYNYQCSSSLITYYAPAFVSYCLIGTVVVPLMKLWGYCAIRNSNSTNYVRGILKKILPPILQPLKSGVTMNTKTAFFNSSRVLIITSINLSLLLTFGAAFPPLALSFAFNILVLAFVSRVELGLFVEAATESKQWIYTSILERECEVANTVTVFQNIVWMLVAVSCIFYTFFLFDALGDTDGFNHSYWVLLFVPTMPLWIYLCYSFIAKRYLKDVALVARVEMVEKTRESGNGSAEMKEFNVGNRRSGVNSLRVRTESLRNSKSHVNDEAAVASSVNSNGAEEGRGTEVFSSLHDPNKM